MQVVWRNIIKHVQHESKHLKKKCCSGAVPTTCLFLGALYSYSSRTSEEVTCQQVSYQGFFSYTIRSVSALNVSASDAVLLCLELYSILVFVPTLFDKKKTYLSQWTTWCWGKYKGTCGFHSTNGARCSNSGTLGDAWGWCQGKVIHIELFGKISFQRKQGPASLLQGTKRQLRLPCTPGLAREWRKQAELAEAELNSKKLKRDYTFFCYFYARAPEPSDPTCL